MSKTYRDDPPQSAARPLAARLAIVCGLLLASGAFASRPAVIAAPAGVAGVDGAVRDGQRPIEAAQVYAYEVASFALRQVLSDRQGHFRFDSLPAGLYKIVAHKEGFLPAVHLLVRRAKEDVQRVELHLLEDEGGDVRDGEAYWDARGQVPADVLREIHRMPALQRMDEAVASNLEIPAAFRTTMGAQGGVESLGGDQGDAHRTSAQVGLEGDIGSVAVGFKGRYDQLAARAGGELGNGEVRAMALSVESAEKASLRVATATAQLPSHQSEPFGADLERYEVAWEGATGEEARTSVTAQFTEQSNFFRAGWVDPTTIPVSSRAWEVEGSYQRSLGDSSRLRTGLSYQQVDGESAYGFADPDWTLDQQQLGVYGIADSRLGSRVMVEYGLFSILRDGGLSVMPHGGIIVDLPGEWSARGTLAHRVETGSPSPNRGFTTAVFGDDDACHRIGEVCYEVAFTRGEGEGQSVKIGAVHREIAETLRLYFSDDFFDRLESLFLVRGDRLPEVQLALARRVSPRILAKLESSYAEGGGGIFYATDSQAYENQVRYLVTSLDTRLQGTSTGIFIAFHHLQQELEPIRSRGSQAAGSQLEVERLQVMLTQDLGLLMDVSSSWAVRFNMELSRGNTPYRLQADDDLHKKLTGGFTVSF